MLFICFVSKCFHLCELQLFSDRLCIVFSNALRKSLSSLSCGHKHYVKLFYHCTKCCSCSRSLKFSFGSVVTISVAVQLC